MGAQVESADSFPQEGRKEKSDRPSGGPVVKSGAKRDVGVRERGEKANI